MNNIIINNERHIEAFMKLRNPSKYNYRRIIYNIMISLIISNKIISRYKIKKKKCDSELYLKLIIK